MPLTIERVWSVNCSHLKNPVTLKNEDITEVDISTDDEAAQIGYFVRVAKGNLHAKRLILGCTPAKHAPGLANTDVLEQIRQLRDRARDQLAEELKESERLKNEQANALKMEGKIDVSIVAKDEPTPKKAKKEPKPQPFKGTLAQNFVTVLTPTMVREGVPDIPGVHMKLLIEPNLQKKSTMSIQFELTEENLLYLHEYAAAQIVSKSIHNVHSRNNSRQPKLGVPGLSRLYKGRHAGKYRYAPKGGRSRVIAAADDDEAKRLVANDDHVDCDSAAAGCDEEEDAVTDDGA